MKLIINTMFATMLMTSVAFGAEPKKAEAPKPAPAASQPAEKKPEPKAVKKAEEPKKAEKK